MAVTVHIPAPLQKWTRNQSRVQIADATSLDELMDGLENDYPGIKGKLVENGEIRPYIRVFLNDEDVRFMKDEGVCLKDGDTVTIVPAIAGGT